MVKGNRYREEQQTKKEASVGADRGVGMKKVCDTLRKGLLTAGVMLALTGCGEEKIDPVSLQPERLQPTAGAEESGQEAKSEQETKTEQENGGGATAATAGKEVTVPGGNALVRLSCEAEAAAIFGSGFIAEITGDTVYICTNRHVVQDEEAWTVTFADGTRADGKQVGCSQVFDVGVVSVETAQLAQETLAALEAVKVDLEEWVNERDSASAAVPVKVYRTGEEGLTGECLEGTIVSFMEYFEYGNGLNHTKMDITLENGDSGSAVFNEKGNLFAMVVGATYATDEKPARWGVPLTSLITSYKEITGREWVSLF